MTINMVDAINRIDEKFLRKDLPEFNVGDYIKMKIKVQEGDKMRLHPYEGTVIAMSGRGIKGSFTVRKISFGEGVEKVFPLNSPVIESISIVSKGLVKRAKLYYLRGATGKKSRIQTQQQSTSVPSAPEAVTA